MESAFYLTMNGTNLFLKPLVSLIIGYTNQAFLSRVGEELSKDTVITIMEEVNRTKNTSAEGVEEAAYARTIPTAVTEARNKLTGAEPGYPAKRLKTFVPPDMDTISDPVISRCITKLQVHLNHSVEVIFGSQASISFLNSKIGDVSEDHITIWCAMGEIMKNLVSHGAVLDNLDLDLLTKEAIEAHLLTVKIKLLMMML